MLEALYKRIPDTQLYLKRIGLDNESIPHNSAGLTRLVQAHLSSVPFDDLDVWGSGAEPSLGIPDLFDKIVIQRRGGYCFELNSLFCAFLKSLGFDAYLVLVRLTEHQDSLPMTAHCAVIVKIDGRKYFADVGYGGPAPYGAVEFDGCAQFGFYLKNEGENIAMYRTDSNEDVRVMLFRDTQTDPIDLIMPNFYVSQNVTAPFRRIVMLNLRKEDCLYIVTDRVFKVKSWEGESTRILKTADELRTILPTYFGISPDTVPMREFE